MEESQFTDCINIPDDVLSLDFDHNSVNYEIIDPEKLGCRAIVVHGILTPGECRRLRELMISRDREPAFDDDIVLTPANPNTAHRNNLRIFAKSSYIATTLLARLSPLLQGIGEHEKRCNPDNLEEFLNGGIGMQGLWKLHHLNPLFRLCKYNPMGHFGPHYDGDYVVDPCTLRSLKTFMLYLNDDYEGGETSFVDAHDLYFDVERGIYCSPPEKVFAHFKARAGDLLVFDHKMLHEGNQVTSGQKYIMRSDVLYERSIDTASLSDNDRLGHEAVRLYHDGMKLEQQGFINEAISLYRRAFKLCPELEKYS